MCDDEVIFPSHHLGIKGESSLTLIKDIASFQMRVTIQVYIKQPNLRIPPTHYPRLFSWCIILTLNICHKEGKAVAPTTTLPLYQTPWAGSLGLVIELPYYCPVIHFAAILRSVTNLQVRAKPSGSKSHKHLWESPIPVQYRSVNLNGTCTLPLRTNEPVKLTNS